MAYMYEYEYESDASPVTVDRREGPYGEVALRRRGEGYEIIANGCFLMDTSDGRSERLLIDAALDALPAGRDRHSLLIGGLGVGFSLARAAAEPRWGRIVVVERERAVVDWHRSTSLREAQTIGGGGRATGGRLAPFSGHALDDARVEVVEADLVSYVRNSFEAFDALCLDIDNGPDWTVTEGNNGLYGTAGLAACRARLTPGGVLGVWSAQPSATFEKALLAAGFTQVRTIEIPVKRGVPDVVHLAIKPA
jgi:spermidine synthase